MAMTASIADTHADPHVAVGDGTDEVTRDALHLLAIQRVEQAA